ncbi:hypothetical protein [Solibacillus sp. FSL K6-1523]
MELYKEDLPPTLAGILDLERQEGIEQGRKERGKERRKRTSNKTNGC